MRRAALGPLVCWAGCTFSPGAVGAPAGDAATAGDGGAPLDGAWATVDAPPADGAAALPPDGRPTWSSVETLTVSADGTVATSRTLLLPSVTYRLRCSGTYVVNNATGLLGDADYVDFAAPRDLDSGGTVDTGLGIDDPTVDLTTIPDWGPYRPAHVYEVDWVGDGGSITAMLHNTNYANNEGALTLEILAPAP